MTQEQYKIMDLMQRLDQQERRIRKLEGLLQREKVEYKNSITLDNNSAGNWGFYLQAYGLIVFEFNQDPDQQAATEDMLIFVKGVKVAYVSFHSCYLFTPFRLTYNGNTYTGLFDTIVSF